MTYLLLFYIIIVSYIPVYSNYNPVINFYLMLHLIDHPLYATNSTVTRYHTSTHQALQIFYPYTYPYSSYLIIYNSCTQYNTHSHITHYILHSHTTPPTASARQRKGRAGRTRAGVCFHLFSKRRHFSLQEFQDSEILRMPLEELVLQVSLWYESVICRGNR